MNPKTAIAMLENAMNVYPNGFFQLNVVTISVTTPIDGRIMM